LLEKEHDRVAWKLHSTGVMNSIRFIRIGDQVVNLNSIVSFDIDGQDIVRIWYVGSPAPLALRPAVPAAALLEILNANNWLL
jgi:hypothetical protein